MKKHALALAVIGACGLVPQAFGHELANSKKENITVDVPGDATNWCKPDVALTITRPAWDNQAMLTGLIAKLPFVLGKDCAQAKVTWKAVDGKGNLYATGSGTAANLGIVTLAATPAAPAAVTPTAVAVAAAPAAPPPAPAPAPVAAAAPVPPVSAPAPASAPAPVTPVVETAASPADTPPVAPAAPVAAPAVANTVPQAPAAQAVTTEVVSVPSGQPVVAQTPTAPAPAPAPAPAAPAPVPAPVPVPVPVPAPAVAGAVAASVPSDYGRSVVLQSQELMQITDGSGCKWLISKSAMSEGESLAFGTTPAMPCPASGFAEGSFDKLSWKIPNTYRGDSWNKVYVHPSTLMFAKNLEAAVKDKAVAFISPRADQALFLLGEIPSRKMNVYLAFERSNYRVLTPFTSDPYYVVTTPDESFALDPAEYKNAALEVFQLIKATSPTTTDIKNFFVAKNLPALYVNGGYGDDKAKIVRNRLGENRGSLYFDVREGSNWAVQREQQRLREERQHQRDLAQVHSRVLARYEQLQAGMKDYEGREAEALAQMAGIQVRFASPLAQQDPSTSSRALPMMVHVTGKKGDFYSIDFPSNGRLVADETFAEGWYVTQVANMTPYLPMEDGRAVPTFRAYSAGAPEACEQDHCADRVSFGAVLAREFPNAGIDFSWTPQVSQKYVTDWDNASAQVQ